MSHVYPSIEYDSRWNYEEMIFDIVRAKFARVIKEKTPNKGNKKLYDLLKREQPQ